MNRNQAKEFYPIMQAFAEGEVIECRTRTWELNKGWQNSTTWKETEELKFQDTYEYRIKPKPKYRQFKNMERCLKEMQKHQPFGWIERNGYWYNIISTGITYVKIIDTRGAITTLCFDDLLSHYSFADGTPFGIKEE